MFEVGLLLFGLWCGGALATAFWLEPEDMYGSRWDALLWPLAVLASILDNMKGGG